MVLVAAEAVVVVNQRKPFKDQKESYCKDAIISYLRLAFVMCP